MTGLLAAAVILGRRSAGLAWAITAELAWHLAGQAWAFAVLAAGLGWVAARIPAAVAAASSKAYAVETRVDALVPVVATVQSTANNAQSTANNALAIVPSNHGFLGTLSSATTGSVNPGAAAGTVPSMNAPFSGQCSVNPASQGYVNALADNVNAIRSDTQSLRGYVSAFAGTYNQTVSAVQHIQDQLNAHGYSSN